MSLTDLAIKGARPGPNRRRLFDGGGLHIEVSPKGAKTWKLSYRFDGKQKTISGGRYPKPMSLAEARGWREACKAKIRAGADPAAEVAAEKRARRYGDTFEDVARTWLANQTHLSEKYRKWLLQRFEIDVFPLLGDKRIDELASDDILDQIHYFEERDTIPMGRKVMRSIRLSHAARSMSAPWPPSTPRTRTNSG
jgi:hypothetical protein